MAPYYTKSKIFLYFCLSFALGVFIASFFKIPVLALFTLAIIAIVFIAIFWRNSPPHLPSIASKTQKLKMLNRCGGKKVVIAGFCLIFLVLGICRYQTVSEKVNIANINIDNGKNIIFQGIIAQEPDVRIKDTQYIVENSQGKNFGRILVTAPHYPVYKYGDLVKFDGKLKIPEKFNSFDYQEYLAKDGIYWTMYNPKINFISSGNGNSIYGAIFGFKNIFKERIGKLLPEPEISFLNGLLLGERSGLGEKLKNDFSITGTSHIVAVSGFNVTIIAVIILELCLLLGFSRGQR